MSGLPEHVTVKMAMAHIPMSVEAAADAASLRAAIDDLLAGRVTHQGPLPSEPRPAAYDRLLAATDGLVREVVELHRPQPYTRGDGSVAWWECRGCQSEGCESEPPHWPCETSGLIATRVGVDLQGDSPFGPIHVEETP